VIGLLASNGFSLEFITFLIGVGFMVGALYFAWILKSQKIKEIE